MKAVRMKKEFENSPSPSLRSFRSTRTFSILPSSAPSSAEAQGKNRTNDPGETPSATQPSYDVGLPPLLTVVTVVVHQNDLFDQVRRTLL